MEQIFFDFNFWIDGEYLGCRPAADGLIEVGVGSENGLELSVFCAESLFQNFPLALVQGQRAQMTKLKNLGLRSAYRVEIYGGAKLTKSERVSVKNYFYDKKIFPLYQSYDGNGLEQVVDKRQSIFSNVTLLITIAALIILVSLGGWYLWGFFHPESKKVPVHQNQPTEIVSQPQQNPAVPAPVASPKISTQWRVSGLIQDKNGRFVILSGADGRQRIEPAGGFVVNGAIISGVLDGEIVTTWSGNVK